MGIMGRAMLTGGCAMAAMLVQTSVNAAPVPANASEAFATFNTLYQAHKCTELLDFRATPTVTAMLDSLPVQYKLAVDAGGFDCAGRTNQFDLAWKFAVAGTELNDPRPMFWLMRLDMAWKTSRVSEVVTTLETMATHNPDALASVDLNWLGDVAGIDAVRNTALKQRIDALFGAPGFHTTQPGGSTDSYRYAYAISEMAAGHVEAAKAIFAQITAPGTLLRAVVDPRLRGLVPPGFDARATTERHMDAAREVAAAHPDDIGAMLAVVNDYALLDKAPEMLALLLPMQPTRDRPANRAKANQVRNWWLELIAAYRIAGDYEHALATYQQTVAPGGINEANPAAANSLATLQLRFGHYPAAMASLAQFDKPVKGVAPVSVAIAHELRGCAAWLGGKPAIAEADLAYLRQHDADAPTTNRTLAMCMHRDDEAAASFIKDLADPDKASGLLVTFSSFAAPPANYPRYWYVDGINRLKLRADIRAALASAGGVGNFNIPPPI